MLDKGNKMGHNKEKKIIKNEEAALKDIFHRWDPIMSGFPLNSPMDEYDCLIHKIISNLHLGINEKDLNNLISEEIKNHFHLNEPQHKIQKVSNEIWQYWQKKPNGLG